MKSLLISRFTVFLRIIAYTVITVNIADVLAVLGIIRIAERAPCVCLKRIRLLSVRIMSRTYLALNHTAVISKSLIRIKIKFGCMLIESNKSLPNMLFRFPLFRKIFILRNKL